MFNRYPKVQINLLKYGQLSIVNGQNLRPTPSAVVNPDGGWLNTATSDCMVNFESSAILLFLK
jgi:hypothetical protein